MLYQIGRPKHSCLRIRERGPPLPSTQHPRTNTTPPPQPHTPNSEDAEAAHTPLSVTLGAPVISRLYSASCGRDYVRLFPPFWEEDYIVSDGPPELSPRFTGARTPTDSDTVCLQCVFPAMGVAWGCSAWCPIHMDISGGGRALFGHEINLRNRNI